MKNILITPEELRELIDQSVTEALRRCQPGKPPIEGPEILTRKQAAEFLRISLVTLNEWCNQGILTPRRLNSRVYFYKGDILKAMQGPSAEEESEPYWNRPHKRNRPKGRRSR